jgi:hypothetical protein
MLCRHCVVSCSVRRGKEGASVLSRAKQVAGLGEDKFVTQLCRDVRRVAIYSARRD